MRIWTTMTLVTIALVVSVPVCASIFAPLPVGKFISWLNNNSGAMIALLTFVLICVTAWYAFITFRMMRITEQQTAIAIEPIVDVSPLVQIVIANERIQIEIINSGKVNVTQLKFKPSRLVLRYNFPSDQGEVMWTTHFPLTSETFELDVLKPGDKLPIELNVASIVGTTEEDRKKFFADFAYSLYYRRAADHKPYELHRDYKLRDGFFLLMTPSKGDK